MTSTFPPCGPDCLKEKELKALKAAMDASPNNAQAKTDYYTKLYGQDWLREQKEKTAKEEVDPVLTSYTSKYEDLTTQLKTQGQFAGLAKAVASDGGIAHLAEDYETEKSKADVLNRLWILNGKPTFLDLDIVRTLLYVVIGILSVYILILAVQKYRKYRYGYRYGMPTNFMPVNRLY
jgi:hypothetical protein